MNLQELSHEKRVLHSKLKVFRIEIFLGDKKVLTSNSGLSADLSEVQPQNILLGDGWYKT